MVDVVSKRCAAPGCDTRPVFDLPGASSGGRFCSAHKTIGMVDVVSKRCAEPGCRTQPSFNLPGASSGGRFCGAHKTPGMVDVVSKPKKRSAVAAAPAVAPAAAAERPRVLAGGGGGAGPSSLPYSAAAAAAAAAPLASRGTRHPTAAELKAEFDRIVGKVAALEDARRAEAQREREVESARKELEDRKAEFEVCMARLCSRAYADAGGGGGRGGGGAG